MILNRLNLQQVVYQVFVRQSAVTILGHQLIRFIHIHNVEPTRAFQFTFHQQTIQCIARRIQDLAIMFSRSDIGTIDGRRGGRILYAHVRIGARAGTLVLQRVHVQRDQLWIAFKAVLLVERPIDAHLLGLDLLLSPDPVMIVAERLQDLVAAHLRIGFQL